jgi:hypothetical protein
LIQSILDCIERGEQAFAARFLYHLPDEIWT